MSLPYKYVILTDFEFEFGGHEGNPPRPVCMVAKELRSGQEWRAWRGDFGPSPPFPVGPDALFVAYYASAELGCFRALGWPMPANVLDLFTEFRARTNGTDWLEGRSLLAALQYYGLSTIGSEHKENMRQLILRGGPWTAQEKADILDYNAGDVYDLERLLPKMLPDIDLPRALQRGRYMRAAAIIEYTGVPIDVDTLNELRATHNAVPHHYAALVHIAIRIADDLRLGRNIEATQYRARRLLHDLLHSFGIALYILDRTADQHRVVHWRMDLDAAFGRHGAGQPQHFRPVGLHRKVHHRVRVRI